MEDSPGRGMIGDLRSDVRILDSRGVPVGVGFLADASRVITCAHVVAAALGNPRLAKDPTPPTAHVGIDFPCLPAEPGREPWRGAAVGWRPLGGTAPADVAVLALDDPAPEPATPITPCTLLAYGDRLLAYGVRADLPRGAYVEARALGFIPGPHIQAVSDHPDTALRQGCSGGAAWSLDRGGVVGMFAQGQLTSSGLLVPIDGIESVYREVAQRGFAHGIDADRAASLDFTSEEGRREAMLSALRRLPLGPAVDFFLIRPSVTTAFSTSMSNLGALQVVGQANQLMLDSLPARPHNPQAYTIQRDTLGAPEIPTGNFWFQILSQACMLGPRMVGAVLQCAPPTAVHGARDDFINLFTEMETWR